MGLNCLVSFEFADLDHTIFNNCSDPITSIHEALCQAIHEQNTDAIQWLTDNITDIKIHREC